MQAPALEPQLLASVRVVVSNNSALQRLPHVTQRINELLDFSASWRLPTAAQHGFVHLVQRLMTRSTGPPDGRDLLEGVRNAVRYGQLPVVQWFYTTLPLAKLPTFLMDFAAEVGQLQIFQWLFEHTAATCTVRALTQAAFNGHLYVVRFLDAHEAKLKLVGTTAAMDHAAGEGFLEVVAFLHESRRHSCTTNAMDGAAAENHLDVVRFLHAHRSEGCTVRAMDKAAAHGHMEIMEFLYQNRREGCSYFAALDALEKRRLDVLQWLWARYPARVNVDMLSRRALQLEFHEIRNWLDSLRPIAAET
jgi:hypothetical protein